MIFPSLMDDLHWGLVVAVVVTALVAVLFAYTGLGVRGAAGGEQPACGALCRGAGADGG